MMSMRTVLQTPAGQGPLSSNRETPLQRGPKVSGQEAEKVAA